MSTINKVAILIDGGFFVKRFKLLHARPPGVGDIQTFLDDLLIKVQSTTPNGLKDILFRTFYYDCRPFGDVRAKPDGSRIDFSQQRKFKTATAFHNDLKMFPQLALRLGDLSFNGWKVDPKNSNLLLPDFKQKTVDIKLGLDIAMMSRKRIIDKLVLVAGDSDFVTPMKFSRRKGILVYLYPMGQVNIKSVLKEHADFILT